jgi:hypothetical protein
MLIQSSVLRVTQNEIHPVHCRQARHNIQGQDRDVKHVCTQATAGMQNAVIPEERCSL